MGAAILIVDDDDALRSMLRVVLEDEGYQVVEAPDGRSALDRLQQSPDSMVILLDLNLPGMDGRHLLEVAQQDDLVRRHAFILVTAAYTRTFPLTFTRLLTQLDVQIVVKPFDLYDLLVVVQQAQERLDGGKRPEPG